MNTPRDPTPNVASRQIAATLVLGPGILLIAALGACGPETLVHRDLGNKSSAIVNGTQDDEGNDNAVFLLMRSRNLDPGTPGAFATSANIKYPRCVLTMDSNRLGLWESVYAYRGVAPFEPDPQDPNKIVLVGKGQKVAKFVSRTDPDSASPWRDLRLVWLENGPGQKKFTEPTGYKPLEIVNDIGLRSSQISAKPKPALTLPRAWKDVQIIGYGADPAKAGADGAPMVRRAGTMNAGLYFQGSVQLGPPDYIAPRAGSYYVLDPKLTPRNPPAVDVTATPGDFGGPALNSEGKVFGIMVPGAAFPNVWVVGLDDGTPPPKQKSNFAWVKKTAEDVCNKGLGFFAPRDDSGNITEYAFVQGKVSPPHDYVQDDPDNPDLTQKSEILVGFVPGQGLVQNGFKAIHADQQADVEVVITVPWLEFAGWQTYPPPESGQLAAPCLCSQQKCTVPYGRMGLYTEDGVSIDNVYCVPTVHFKT